MFSSNFWESDFVSQVGFDTLVQRMKDGRQTCRDIEEFLKARAKAEEDFAKTLLKIAKVERAPGESGTLKSSIEVLRREAESEAGYHMSHAQHLTEEANKLADFREKQREERKRHEDVMHRTHKNKSDNYRRQQNLKTVYETKFRAAEKADSEYERVKFGAKSKEMEKAEKNKSQCRAASVKADEAYSNSVNQLEIARKTWELDHRNTCDVFQRQEEERLQYLRNALWVYANLGSDTFVNCDDSRETMRVSLEKCDPQCDLMDFVSRKSTGTDPLPPIVYTPCGGSPGSHRPGNNVPGPVAANNAVRSPSEDYSFGTYAAIDLNNGGMRKTFRALYTYAPRQSGEIDLQEDDRITVTEQGADGWWTGTNTRTGLKGLFPANYVESVQN